MSEEIRFCGSVDEAPSLPGAYVIALELGDPLAVTLLGQAAIELPAGRYLYCGSAKVGRIKGASFTPFPSRKVRALAYRPADRTRQRSRQLDFPRR